MNKVALGMITRNDKKSLGRYLPIVRPCFDGAIVLDAESTDGSLKVLKKHDFTILSKPWGNDFSAARNLVIKMAEDMKYTHIFFLDSDECMFPDDIVAVRRYLEQNEFIALPRIEFVKDNKYFTPIPYPDHQRRVFKLGVGYHYQNKVHEIVYKGGNWVRARMRGSNPLKLSNCPIYHYGKCRPAKYLWLKYENYDRLEKGEPLLDKVPKGTKITPENSWRCVPMRYFGRQPL